MSTADKRSVSTDALATLGTIIDDQQKRDAIHLAVEPVVAGERLEPGEHISVKEGVAFSAGPGVLSAALGIIDPFLTRAVRKGERFWFIMYPRMVHSLRHVWTHPAFPDEVGTPAPTKSEGPDDASKEASRTWIERYADSIGVVYDELMEAAREHLYHGSYLVRGSLLEGVYTDPEFWSHYQMLTGTFVPEDKRENFFSCTC